MRKVHLALVLCALLLSACSDDSTSPNEDPNSNGGENSFAIISVDRDTVYWGDSVVVTLRNAKSDSFSVFLHTIPVKIDSSWSDTKGSTTIYFHVAVGVSSGQIRIFERDVQAKGDHSLVIVPQSRLTLHPIVYAPVSEKAYVGDLLVIPGRDIPLGKSDIAIDLEGNELQIITWDTSRILVRVPPGAKTGTVYARVFTRRYGIGKLTILEPGGRLLEQRPLKQIQVESWNLQGVTRTTRIAGSDTVSSLVTDILRDFNPVFPMEPVEAQISSDSVIYSTDQRVGSDHLKVEIRLKIEPENRVSGRIWVEFGNEQVRNVYEFHVKNMRWTNRGDYYQLSVYSLDLPKQLAAFSYGGFSKHDSHMFTYETGSINSYIVFNLSF